MPGLRVRLFGRASIEVDGQQAELTPTATAVLVRLIIAEGAPVTVDEIFRDIWQHQARIDRDDRVKVQRRILEIRDAIDPDNPGEASRLVRTERGRPTAYRLVLARDAIDVLAFSDLVVQSRRAPLDERIPLLESALAGWADPPLAGVFDQPWAVPAVRRLRELRTTATRELLHAYEAAGRHHDALDVAEKLSWERPEDAGLAATLASLRERLLAGRHKPVFRAEFPEAKITVVVMSGDLFGDEEANLVVGFADTFDTDTDRNIVISAESTQGLLLQRLYHGDRKRLDKELRAALSHVVPASVERPSAKPRGKRTRYPAGTVATLHHTTRRVFAVAYSQLGNDLVARSSLPMLSASLENLWGAVYLHGQLKPVAMPLIGSGLSRTHATPGDLLAMIVSSFVASSRRRYISPELRVIVKQQAFDKIRVAEVLESVRTTIGDGAAAPAPEGRAGT